MTTDLIQDIGMFGPLKSAESQVKLQLAIIVPAYNESGSIGNSVCEIYTKVKRIPSALLIVVNDGSTDSTYEELCSLDIYKDTKKFVIVNQHLNTGYGGACIAGYNYAKSVGCTHVLYMDSDLTNSPDDILKFYEFLKSGFDYVKASRFEIGGGVLGIPLYRRIHSSFGAYVARKLLGNNVSDPTNGFRALRVGLIDYEKTKSRGFPLIMEEIAIVAISNNLKLANVPVLLTSRETHQRNTSFNYSIKTYFNYLYPCLLVFIRKVLK